MATFKPFRALRPKEGWASRLAAPPYDVLSSQEARLIVEENPYSFLSVTRPEVGLAEELDIHDPRLYAKAKEKLAWLQAKGVLIRDSSPHYYIYRLISQGRAQVGLVGLSSIDDYLDGVIKKHEKTRPDKEEDRRRHIEACYANTGPVFLAYRGNNFLAETLRGIYNNYEPTYDFSCEDGSSHSVWLIDNKFLINSITRSLKAIQDIYIADGHHRAAAAVKVGLSKREENSGYSGDEGFNYFLTVLFAQEELEILPYNRLVKDLGKLGKEELIQGISEKFIIKSVKSLYNPQEKHHFGMFLDGNWYELTAREEILERVDSVEKLDAALLQDHLLGPLLGIGDPRTDERIDFLGGPGSFEELETRLTGDMELAFTLYPTSLEELMRISDEGKLMPPKSTWFEPKLRSGLFTHCLDD